MKETDDVVIAALDALKRAAWEEHRCSGSTLLIFGAPGFACLVGVDTGAPVARRAYQAAVARPKRAKRRGS